MTIGRINREAFRETMQEQREAAKQPGGHALVTRANIRLLEDQLKEATVGE